MLLIAFSKPSRSCASPMKRRPSSTQGRSMYTLRSAQAIIRSLSVSKLVFLEFRNREGNMRTDASRNASRSRHVGSDSSCWASSTLASEGRTTAPSPWTTRKRRASRHCSRRASQRCQGQRPVWSVGLFQRPHQVAMQHLALLAQAALLVSSNE